MRIAAEVLSLAKVRRDGQRVCRVGRHFEFLARLGTQLHGPHQFLNAMQAPGVVMLLTQDAVDAGRPVAATMNIRYLADDRTQAIALALAL